MTSSHDQSILSPSSNLKLLREAISFNHKAVISRGSEGTENVKNLPSLYSLLFSRNIDT